jgi:ZIP family zinc transporter
MSFAHTALLGALAGFTIYLGLPIGRLRVLGDRTRVSLAMFAVGILAFILVDVLSHASGILEEALGGYKAGSASFAHVAGYAVLMFGGFALGSAGLTIVERRLRLSGTEIAPMAGGSSQAAALSAHTLPGARPGPDAARQRALRTGMVIAVAIGLHNFAEGLAIGVSARAGQISLATVLIIGFALHNATEGFGIVGPLGSVRPSWRWLALAGLISGGPTFLGSMAGYEVTSQPLELAFYALAGGAIFYVVCEILHAVRRFGHRELASLVLAAGFAVGVLTDLVVIYGGG